MALGIDAISGGRFAINLVSAWFKPEMEKSGITFLSHSDRYRYSQEWIEVVKALWSGEQVNYSGKFFQIDELSLHPRPLAHPYPQVYLGGESDSAKDLAMREADVFFLTVVPLK